MKRQSVADWFTPETAPEDAFVAPNFHLGQFFYTKDTAARLAEALDRYSRPCCLCTPRLAYEWWRRGRVVRLLDFDTRFSDHPGYQQFDLLHPHRMTESFDVIIFDPIFVDAVLLSTAVNMVTYGSDEHDLFMTFPVDRERELLNAFSQYELAQLDFPLACCNIRQTCQPLFRVYGTAPLFAPGR